MAYIELAPDDQVEGPLKQIYEQAMQRAGYVAQIIRVMSRDQRTCAESIQFYIGLMKTPNALPAPQREMLAAVVSNVNDCYY